MFDGPGRDTDYHRSKQSDIARDSTTQYDTGNSSAYAGGWAGLSHLMESQAIRSSYNAPLRTEVMHGMQQTHGNRAVQRYLGAGEEAHDSPGFGLPFGLGDLARRGGQVLGQLGQAASQQAYRGMVDGATDFAGDMASTFLGGTPLGPMLGIPEKKSFLQSLPLIGGVAGRGEEMGSSLLSGGMGVLGALGHEEKANTRDIPLPLAGIPFIGTSDMRDLLDQGHEMEGGGTGVRWEPSKAGEAARPYAYAKVNEYGGQERGAGLSHEEYDIFGVPITSDFAYGVDKQGTFGTDNGDTRFGMLRNIGYQKKQINQGGIVSADAEALTAGYELSAGTDGATAGIGANLIAGSISAGQATDQSHNDEQVRFGLSVGAGAAGRGYWGDKDGDGYNEYGVGADFGIFSADLKTEDPLGTLAKGAVSAIPGANMLLDYFKGDYNMTYGTSMSEDKAAAQEVQNNDWMAKMRAEEEDEYDSKTTPMPYHIPYQ
jgi:hypothetical protein